MTPQDNEFTAMQAVFEALKTLESDVQLRVLTYIIDRLGLDLAPAGQGRGNGDAEEEDQVEEIKQKERGAPKFGSFAELFDATQPSSNAEKALVAGYWLQVCQGAESFDGQSANSELKNLGHGLGNVTNAVDSLKGQKPALALQLKKSGTSQQARKTYKITVAGIKAVEGMISG